VITRLIANDLSAQLGTSFFVDNRSGAGNTLGSREAARSDADGYTLLMSSASGQVISPLVYKNVDYDPIKSFTPIGLVAEGSIILVVNPSLPFKSLPQLVAHAKANPGKLTTAPQGPAPFRIWPASCSSRRPATISCMSPIAGAHCRSPTSSAATCS
jgi:tripartite-type tricarboxylate transporter receptor subunit TctC